jgi:fused signal recognition particle receptor
MTPSLDWWILLAAVLAGATPLAVFAALLRRGTPQPSPAPAAPARVESRPRVALPEPTAAPLAPTPVPVSSANASASEALLGRLGSLLGGRGLDDTLLDELEALLFGADLGVATAEDLLARVRREAASGGVEQVRAVLRKAILEELARVEPVGDPLALAAKPHVVLVLGVNGSGKTTTIGKLAARHRALGRRVVLGAGDTFRAAAREQLQRWSERTGCELVAGPTAETPPPSLRHVKAAIAREATWRSSTRPAACRPRSR